MMQENTTIIMKTMNINAWHFVKSNKFGKASATISIKKKIRQVDPSANKIEKELNWITATQTWIDKDWTCEKNYDLIILKIFVAAIFPTKSAKTIKLTGKSLRAASKHIIKITIDIKTDNAPYAIQLLVFRNELIFGLNSIKSSGWKSNKFSNYTIKLYSKITTAIWLKVHSKQKRRMINTFFTKSVLFRFELNASENTLKSSCKSVQ